MFNGREDDEFETGVPNCEPQYDNTFYIARKGEVTSYDQNFEHPVAFVNDGGDVNVFNPVNELYGNQPTGPVLLKQIRWTRFLSPAIRHLVMAIPIFLARGNYALGMLSP
ncbi:hypothetical protein C8R31_101858 [Nitrosospira sp. Nsp2]|nr:hypothetical protein C8R31_101858 [Nitrosospira sp. Nsp2]